MVYLIAFVPAVIQFLISIGLGSKSAAMVCLVINIGIGLLTGNPIFAGLDVLAAMLAYVLAVAHIGRKASSADLMADRSLQPWEPSGYSISNPEWVSLRGKEQDKKEVPRFVLKKPPPPATEEEAKERLEARRRAFQARIDKAKGK